ncbi:MAG: MaoC family dehydratase [Proteobacteria bacterium]|nr:MaoC family dehydratase [Pseudomonadota bacterium]MBU1585251.1 MaoC family dehydratase [Pseudomonadota bacterium]MBU2452530.1 MaoC family dehydratase [Pseudomonadota bacterium]MBU2627974.1 MaoC family dehydratase [Pseudomonadota bacterium]
MTYQLTTFDDLAVGQKAFLHKTITEADISHFIAITGDKNPLHVDERFAEQTFFGQRIAHGMLSAALFSTLVGMHLPGLGAIFRSQTLEFLHPVFIGDTLCAWFEIMAIDPEAEQIQIKSWIDNQEGKTVIQGQTIASLLRGFKKNKAEEKKF